MLVDDAHSEVNHRWGMITALCRIGFAALALGDGAEARERFGEALERARASQAISARTPCIEPQEELTAAREAAAATTLKELERTARQSV